MAGKYALMLNDDHAGWLIATGDGPLDVDPWIRRKDGVVGFLPASPRGLWPWVDASIYGERSDGAIVAFDDEGRELERLELTGAAITELTMPTLGGGAQPGALLLRVRLTAAEVRHGGEASAAALQPALALTSCRLQLGGPAPLQVRSIAGLTVYFYAGHRPGSLLQRVVLSLDRPDVDELGDEETLVGREGSLEYLAPDGVTPLAALDFRVAGAHIDAMEVTTDGPPRARVELACRGMQFAVDPTLPPLALPPD